MSNVPDCPVDLLNDVHEHFSGLRADLADNIVQRAWVRGYAQGTRDCIDRMPSTKKETPNGEEG